MENNQHSFWQFSDQLRLQSTNLANLSLNDSIWGNSFTSKRPEERKNFDIRVGGDRSSSANLKQKGSDYNVFNDGWKIGTSIGGTQKNVAAVNDVFNKGSDHNVFNVDWKIGTNIGATHKNVAVNGVSNKGIYSKQTGNNMNISHSNSNNYNYNKKSSKNNKKNDDDREGKGGNKNDNNSNNSKTSVAKRFKTLPPSESLPRFEAVGGYIFVCNNDTMQENLKRQLFGLPPRYRDSVRAITPGLPLFLYNYSTHQLHGIFEAASFGGTNIDPAAWEDKKNPGESRFPAQVRVVTRKNCEPLEEDSFRPILHHYDGPKFRLELNIPEALALLDIFAENNP
ncbi:PREDICTED: B2 protein [Nelumbo nucifera]|uniref:B2 protein n=1 Tax=Nelumbo nucifera TaxID=4432 RepID=A0A1U8AN77_NELNU|nr:PREDICTED: B2 protein [Nelumbo nucifera]